MPYVQNYPLKSPLPVIHHHEDLPVGAVEIGRLRESATGHVFSLVVRGRHLSVLKSYILPLREGDKYFCSQFDFPINVMTWFPAKWESFRRAPNEGGLPAGTMTTGESDVSGEMLGIESTTSGYYLANWSRNDHDRFGTDFEPMTLSLDYRFLYDDGFIKLLQRLGEGTE